MFYFDVYMSVLDNIHVYNPLGKSELIVLGQFMTVKASTSIQHRSASNT